MTFHEALLAARKTSGLRQYEVAKKVGVVQSTVSEWERGHLVPVSDSYERLARIFPGLSPPSSMKERTTPVGNPNGNPGKRNETTKRNMSLAARRNTINRIPAKADPPMKNGNGQNKQDGRDKRGDLRAALSGLEACVWTLRAIIDGI